MKQKTKRQLKKQESLKRKQDAKAAEQEELAIRKAKLSEELDKITV